MKEGWGMGKNLYHRYWNWHHRGIEKEDIHPLLHHKKDRGGNRIGIGNL